MLRAMLKLSYTDKYRLWSDLMRSSVDRLFVATSEALQLGSTETLEIHLVNQGKPVVVEGRVVGRRPKSRRFEAGIYVRIPEHELEKCRRFLGLRRPAEAESRARHNLRVHHEAEVRFLDPKTDASCHTRNISEAGLFVVGDVELVAGQHVRIELDLDGAPMRLDALVAWSSKNQNAAGLELIDLDPSSVTRLRHAIAAYVAHRAAVQPAGPRPVVVADDDDSILLLLNRSLSKSGYDVYQASDGDQATELIRRLHPALVVLDVLLPGVDGAHVCKTMRSDAELSDIPVLLVSALEETALHGVADDCGATDYLTKPLDLDELVNLLGAYLAT
jgi:CheY-like chemotaxis protein